MNYLKTKLQAIRSEYTRPDRAAVITAAGDRCTICKRQRNDEFLFGPTHYLKTRIRMKVSIDIHVIDGAPRDKNWIVICSGCHLGYHLFNRLAEDAELFGRQLSKTLYKRCKKCMELSCSCCGECNKAMKWCKCGEKKAIKKVAKKAKARRKKAVKRKASVKVRKKK